MFKIKKIIEKYELETSFGIVGLKREKLPYVKQY